MTLAQAIANAESITPKDPITALVTPRRGARPAAARAAPPRSRPARSRRRRRRAAQPPAQPPAPPQPQPPRRSAVDFAADVPGSGPKQYIGHPINFDFEDADLRAVLRVFANESGLNMIIDPAGAGARQRAAERRALGPGARPDPALEQARLHGRGQHPAHRAARRSSPTSSRSSRSWSRRKRSPASCEVQTFPLSYAKGDTLSPLLTKSALSPRGQIQVDTRTNTLIITDLPDRLQTAQQLIATLDEPQPQVEVEARVVQTTRDFARAHRHPVGLQRPRQLDDRQHHRPGVPEQRLARRPRRRASQGPTDPRGGNAERADERPPSTCPSPAATPRSGWRSARSTAPSTSTSR